jgi:uncharacterized membrane protein
MNNRKYLTRVAITLILILLILGFVTYDISHFRSSIETKLGYTFDVSFIEKIFWFVFFVGDVILLLVYTFTEKYIKSVFTESTILDEKIKD